MGTNSEMGEKESEVTPTPETSDVNPNTETDHIGDTLPSESDDTTPDVEPEKGDEPQQEKMYTKEEVENIMHERTKNLAKMREEYQQYKELGSVEEIRDKTVDAKPTNQAEELDEEDKKFIEYLNKVRPDLSTDKKNDVNSAFIEQLKAREELANRTYLSQVEANIGEYGKGKGYDENKVVILKDTLATIIQTDPELYSRFIQRDPSVTKGAIAKFEETMKPFLDSKIKELSSNKAKVEVIKKPLPKEGISAPIATPKKLTENELNSQAFDAFTNGGGK